MFLHARKGHVEPLGKGCDRSVRTPELLQNAASGGVRERAERGIEVGLAILYHMVQYTTRVTALQWEAERFTLQIIWRKYWRVIWRNLSQWTNLRRCRRKFENLRLVGSACCSRTLKTGLPCGWS